MVPIGVEHDPDPRAIRVEVAGVLVCLDHEWPAGSADPDHRSRLAADERGRQQGPHEGRGILAGLVQEVNQPARRGRLAVRAGDGEERAAKAGRGVGDQLLAARRGDTRGMRGQQLGMIRIDRGQGLAHRDLVGPRPSVAVDHVGRARAARRSGSPRLRLPGCRPTARPSRSRTSGRRPPGRAGAKRRRRCRPHRSRGSARRL